MSQNATAAEIRAFNQNHHWYNRLHSSGLQPVNDQLDRRNLTGIRDLDRLGGTEKIMDRFRVEHPDKKIELVQYDQFDSVLDASGLFWHPSITEQQREGNFPNFRITNADGFVWYWDGFFCP